MSINRRDIMQMLRDENTLLKTRNLQVSRRLARLQQAFRVLIDIEQKTEQISAQLDVSKLFSQLLQLVLHTCSCENGSMIMLDDDELELEFVEVIGLSRDALLNHRLSADTGIVGNVIKTGQAVLVENVHSSRKWSSSIDEYLDFHTASLMCVPLKIDKKIIGAIEVVNKTGDIPFDDNDLNVIRVAACYVGQALQRAEQLILTGDIK